MYFPPQKEQPYSVTMGSLALRGSYLYFYGERKQAGKVGMRLCKKLSLGDRRERGLQDMQLLD